MSAEVAFQREVRSSEYPYNMAGWLTEKARNASTCAARMSDILRDEDALPPALRERLQFELAAMLHDLTKILSFASGGQWSTEDERKIFAGGVAGLEEVRVQYGLLRETTVARQTRETMEMLDDLEALLRLERGVARTQIHAVLARRSSDPEFADLRDMTEALTQGELGWADYVDQAREFISFMRAVTTGEPPALAASTGGGGER